MEGSESTSPWAGGRDLAKQTGEESSKASGWYPDPEQPQTQRYWDGEKWGKRWVDPQTPGWHLKEGTLRYFDGSAWTDHITPPSTLTPWSIAGAVCVGILAAFFIIWLGAQISPEHIYLPVKFVVKELPNFR